MEWIWLIIIVILIIIEAMGVNLVTIWYVASGIVALILSFFIDSFFIEFLVFSLLGTLLLITSRKYLVNLISNGKDKDKNSKTNLDRIIGEEGIVTESISKHHPGEVKVDGKRWTAVAKKEIKVDSTVKVLSINGVKLEVEEV